MKTALLDQVYWDLVLDSNGNIAIASDPYSVAQDVASAIRLFLGELWYNTSKGVPYFQQILGRKPAVQAIQAQFVKAALTVPGVTSATCTLASVKNRELSGQIIVTYSPQAAVSGNAGSTPAQRLALTFVGTNKGILTFIGSNGNPLQFLGN